jgi:ribonuclease BN (tRNA processing enzyme)
MLRKIAAVIAALMSLAAAAHAADPVMKVTLLGTAGPEYFPDRLGISTLVEANGELLLFDVGRGANQRLYQSRINPKDIARIFPTHLHNDHFEGLPDLWMTPCAVGYDEPLVMGLDRMAIEIGDAVKVIPPRSIDDLPNLDSKGQAFP